MPFIAPGFSFQDGVTKQCSADNLHSLLESATVTAIALGEFDSSSTFVFQVDTAEPGADQGEGSYWYDSTNDILRQKREGRWDDANNRPELTTEELVMMGSPLVPTDDDKVSPTASSSFIIGCAFSTAASGTAVLVNTFGYHPVLTNGPISRGDLVVSADVTGYAMSGTFVAGDLDWPMGTDFGICMGSAASGFSGLVTCFIYR
jgi:hypothetical protein